MAFILSSMDRLRVVVGELMKCLKKTGKLNSELCSSFSNYFNYFHRLLVFVILNSQGQFPDQFTKVASNHTCRFFPLFCWYTNDLVYKNCVVFYRLPILKLR